MRYQRARIVRALLAYPAAITGSGLGLGLARAAAFRGPHRPLTCDVDFLDGFSLIFLRASNSQLFSGWELFPGEIDCLVFADLLA